MSATQHLDGAGWRTDARRVTPSPVNIETILRTTRTIAVLGARAEPSAAGHYVAAYLHTPGVPREPARGG